MKSLATRLSLLMVIPLLLASCGGGSGGGSGSGTTPVSITFGSVQKGVAKTVQAPVPADAQHVLLFVEAADITTRIEAEQPVTPGQTATLNVTVPNGIDRRFEVWAYNSLGLETYAGIASPINLTGTPVTVPVDMQARVPACQFQLNPNFVHVSLGGTPVQVQLIQVTAPPACAWMTVADPQSPWITVTPTKGFGSQPIMIGAQPAGAPRFGLVTIAGQQLQVEQM